MEKEIKIFGSDILDLDGCDHTGALKELGFDKLSNADVWDKEFLVDLDFIIRHGLYRARRAGVDIYEKYYKGSEQYLKYYNEGKQAYLNGEAENNPHTDSNTINDPEYWIIKLRARGYPWYEGYRETKKEFNYKTYKIAEFQQEVKDLISKYGFWLKYTDEYGTPYIETKDGFYSELC